MPDRWTADQAGAHCETVHSPNGVSGKTYRNYVRLIGAPNAVGRDLDTGEKLYDPDAVRAWHASRPGQGSRTDLKENRAMSQPITEMSPTARIRDIAGALVHEAAMATGPGQHDRLEAMAADLVSIAKEISLAIPNTR